MAANSNNLSDALNKATEALNNFLRSQKSKDSQSGSTTPVNGMQDLGFLQRARNAITKMGDGNANAGYGHLAEMVSGTAKQANLPFLEQSANRIFDVAKGGGGFGAGIPGFLSQGKQGLQQMGGAFGADTHAGTAAGGVIRGVGSIASGVGGMFGPEGAIVGEAINMVAKFAATLAESLDKLRAWGQALHEANAQFAEFSASMAVVVAGKDVRDIYRKQEQGENRAGGAEFLADAIGDLEDTMAPIEDALAEIKNVVCGAILNVVNVLIKSNIIYQLAVWLGKGDKDEHKDLNQINMNEWANEIGAEKFKDSRPNDL